MIDRVACTLQSRYRDQFIADVQSLRSEDTPRIFQRSSAAWETHPGSYREREESVAETRERLAYVIPMLGLPDEAAKGGNVYRPHLPRQVADQASSASARTRGLRRRFRSAAAYAHDRAKRPTTCNSACDIAGIGEARRLMRSYPCQLGMMLKGRWQLW